MEQKKNILLCIDSDGCVIDAMDIKHKTCFGPCFIEEWELFSEKERLLKRWDTINLYSMNRGINRFKGLLMILQEVDRELASVPGLSAFERWVTTTKALSEASLSEAIKKEASETSSPEIAAEEASETSPATARELSKGASAEAAASLVCLQKVLNWSRKVNKAIGAIDKDQIRPFPGAKKAILAAKIHADIAVVSSANREAVEEEWERYGLLPLTNYFFAQDAGTKKACIRRLLEEGYDADKVVMIGDAPGDFEAAAAGGVHFYPILAGHETDSWEKVPDILDRLLAGDWSEAFQKELVDAFHQNLKEEE